MGFYVTDRVCTRQAKPETPLKKSRLEFFSTSRSRAGFSVSQPVETVSETAVTPTIIVSGVRYYGYRYYNPSLGRWLSRDPVGERGGLSSYGFVGNKSLNDIDYLGLFLTSCRVISGPTVSEGAQWEFVQSDFIGNYAGAFAIALNSVEVTWKIKGKVGCCCTTLFFFQSYVTKDVSKTAKISKGFLNPPIMAFAPGNLPMDLPAAASLAEAIATAIAGAAVQGAYTGYYIYKDYAGEVATTVAATKPSSTEDGDWPANPCD